MMPSDYFVYFYNEIFKELAKLGPEALDRYYARIADRQAYFTLEAFKRDGLKGMCDYWERIRVEENSEIVNELDEGRGFYQFRMIKCPYRLRQRAPSGGGARGRQPALRLQGRAAQGLPRLDPLRHHLHA